MIENITYFKIRFSLASPLAVGSGENRNTDSDVILNSINQPFIPAASLAGVIRHFLIDINSFDEKLWGYIRGTDSVSSRIRFYDVVFVSDNFITVRDSVALENKLSNETDNGENVYNKVGIRGAKFDKEAVEANAELVTMIELHNPSENEKECIFKALSAIDSGFLRVGSKTTRGYGRLKITALNAADFHFPTDRENWLGFDQYDYNSEKCYVDISQKLKEYSIGSYADRITIRLKQKGAVSIRSYTVKDLSCADYIQLSAKDGTPLIPGTSWAGAFRSRLKQLSQSKKLTDTLFGFVDTVKGTQQRSRIFFSESRIENGVSKLISRTSIDRFTAGVKEKALYSEITCYNGECVLEIMLLKNIPELEKCRTLLSAVICDLDRGYLGVGGLTSIGRGLFEITGLYFNDVDVTQALKECNLRNMLGDGSSE